MKIIKNGQLVLSNKVVRKDLAIEGEKIVAIEETIAVSDNDTVIDAKDCYVFAGFIDGHTHLDMDNGVTMTADNFETGTKSAVAGGTTTIIDFATQEKGNTLADALSQWHVKAKDNCYSNYSFHMAITDWNESVKKEIPLIIEQGITSFKIYFAYDALKMNDYQSLDILFQMKEHGGLLGVHCENGEMVNYLVEKNIEKGNMSPKFHPLSRPSEVEAEAINRLLYIAKIVDFPVQIVHLSCELGLNEIRKARKAGQKVFVETCPQYMLLDDSLYEEPNFEGAKYVISPPLRKKTDIEEIVAAVKNGEIDTIATDHCSFNFESQKKIGLKDFSKIPGGAPGLEHRVELIYTYFVDTGILSVNDMAKLLSENPAIQYGMGKSKGKLEVGFDADIVVLKTGVNETITAKKQLQNVDYTPFENFRRTAKTKTVLVNGAIAYENGIVSDKKYGKYIKRNLMNF